MDRQGDFDYILLETTGLADPGNLAPMFWLDEGLGSSIFLDGIVTLVDAKNLSQSLDEPAPADDPSSVGHVHTDDLPAFSTAHMQIAHADVVVVNKRDLVSEKELDSILARVKAINGLAMIHITEHSKVPALEGVLLDLNAYDSVDSEALAFGSKGHSHLDSVSLFYFSLICPLKLIKCVQTVSTIALPVHPLDEEGFTRLDAWLRNVLWELTLPSNENKSQDNSNFEVLRAKGRLICEGGGVKTLQAVRDVFNISEREDEEHGSGAERVGKVVLIGRGLNYERFLQSLQDSLEQST